MKYIMVGIDRWKNIGVQSQVLHPDSYFAAENTIFTFRRFAMSGKYWLEPWTSIHPKFGIKLVEEKYNIAQMVPPI